MANEADLKELAAQLRQPEGPKGIEVGEMMHQTNIGMTRRAIALLRLREADHVMELGHGNGAHIASLLQLAPSLHYTGLDIAPLMHKEAEHQNQEYVKDGHAAFYLYDGLHIPFEADSFDKIFTVNTVYFWSEPLQLLEELYRVLKPGGRLTITYAQRSFMEQLPFTQFGFDLYDDARMLELVKGSSFHVAGSEPQEERVRTKTGDLVERAFTTVILEKV